MGRANRFRHPPADDPVGAAKSSIAFRLNSGFFLRQLILFVAMDLLLAGLALFGLVFYAENRCADVAALVAERGIPSADALVWMEATDYTITPLNRNPEGFSYPPIFHLKLREETADGLRSYDLPNSYAIELPNHGSPYAIRIDLAATFRLMKWITLVLLVCQGISLLLGLLKTNQSVQTVLRPIQDLAAAASRLNAASHMPRQDLETLAGELEKINAKHLDSRIDLPCTQKELRALAQAINAMLDRVNSAYSAQARFVSDASHELRTPIAVIQGYAALLDRWGKEDPEALQESIDAIRSEAKSMEALVEQLLFLARGDNDTQPVKLQSLDLTALAGDVLREEEMICPERSFLPQWEEQAVTVRADPGLIKQTIRVLTDNAIKYSVPGSRIWLRVSSREGYARVTVQDEGMGISPEGLPHVFDRFYRTDQSRDRKTGGTGLGLAIAKWIVERHGGWFEVASREGVGTRFTFLLPIDPAQQFHQPNYDKESPETLA